jgi:hypothetical protein
MRRALLPPATPLAVSRASRRQLWSHRLRPRFHSPMGHAPSQSRIGNQASDVVWTFVLLPGRNAQDRERSLMPVLMGFVDEQAGYRRPLAPVPVFAHRRRGIRAVDPMWWIPPLSQAASTSSYSARSASNRTGQSGSYGVMTTGLRSSSTGEEYPASGPLDGRFELLNPVPTLASAERPRAASRRASSPRP